MLIAAITPFVSAQQKFQLKLTPTFSELAKSFQKEEDKKSLYEQLTERFKKKYLSIGALIQTRADFQPERTLTGNNGFEISRLRFRLYGELDKGHGYSIQANFLDSPAILDAKIYSRFSTALTLDVGLFKSPFSREFLTSATNLDFIKRAQVVDALAPSRQIGIHARGWLKENVLSYAAGIFNGNDFGENENDNDNFLYVGRLVFSGKPIIHITSTTREEESGKTEYGINVAYSNDDDVTIGKRLIQNFEGTRFLVGADFRSIRDRVVLSAEAIYAWLNPSVDPTTNPFGWHATIGYKLTQDSQILFRWDGLEPDGLQSDSHLLIIGYNRWPTKVTQLQINYIITTEDSSIEHNQILVQFQLGF